MLRAVREILETAMLLANREQEIHRKELISRVLMGLLDNMNKVKLQKRLNRNIMMFITIIQI